MSFDASHQLGQTVGAKIRAARQAKKYTQSQLAQPEFSVSYISAIERGQIQPSLRALEILTRRLGITPTDVLPQTSQGDTEALPELENHVSPENTRDLAIVEAQVALQQGESEQAITFLNTLLSQDGDSNILLYVLLGQAYLQSGRIQESEQTLSRAAGRIQEATDFLAARILHLQSQIYASTYNTDRALALQQESLALLEQIASSEPFLLARTYNNLGQQYSHLEQWQKAEEMYQQAWQLLHKRTTYEQVQEVYWKLLQEHKEQEEWSEAVYYSYKCLSAHAYASWSFLKSEIQHELNKAQLQSKSEEEAYNYLLAALKKSQEQRDQLAQASLHVHLAGWFVEREEFRNAGEHIRDAIVMAEPAGATTVLAEAYLLLGELAYKHQNYQEGDSSFELGLAMLEKLEKRQDLLEHLTAYAQLLEAENFISRALIYWKRAYECRQKDWDVPL